MLDARKAALEEAASVLHAVSTNGGDSDIGAAENDDTLNNTTSPIKSIAENGNGNTDSPSKTIPTTDTDVVVDNKPKSRSDVLAAAKRRAEERKRAKLLEGDRKPAALPSNNNTSQSPQTQQSQTNATNQMDWFNLLSVVTNPTSGHQYDIPTSPTNNNSAHNNYYYSQRGLSSHGTSISLDHVGSDGTRGGGSSGSENNDTSTVAGMLNAAGLSDWANYANTSSNQVASSVDNVTGWFDHYSRKYLGTVAGIDSGSIGMSILGTDEDISDGDAAGGGGMVGAVTSHNRSNSYTPHPSMIMEYEPEFGSEDIPTSQLEELPPELLTLDLASVDKLMQSCGQLGMRFEDRGGGFYDMRERSKRRKEKLLQGSNNNINDEEEEEKKNTATIKDDEYTMENSPTMATLQVPEIFFSPYFDLTDPSNFESLLVIGDEEVAQIREKEAKLHALADQKVKDAEAVADLDAKNEKIVPRVSVAHNQDVKGEESEVVSGATKGGTSLTKDAKTTLTPTDGNVITLRKPETFTSHLDAIELVLLDQVRSKSERFFRETNRFSELQSLVITSVDEVRELRTEIHSIRERCVTNVEIVPIMDDSRKDLRSISKVLEAVEDVVNCKASIASLMGAGDHLGAIEAITLARSLLSDSPDQQDDDDEDDDDAQSDIKRSASSSSHPQQQQQHHLSLGKLKALSKVGEQLNEYEKLVVQNLTDELVETFLSWGTDSTIDYRAPPRISLTTDKRAKIRGVVQSLRVCGKLSGAGVAYRKKLCELISVTVRAIVTECVKDSAKISTSNSNTDGSGKAPPPKGTMAGVANMSLEQFFDCLNMLFEQVLGLLWGAFAVNKFCIDEGFILDDNIQKTTSNNNEHTPSATAAALAAAADLSEKSVSELLRLRREAHSLMSFDGMRTLWNTSLTFTHQLEKFSGRKAYGLRSTLLAQAKSFVERKHESNMSALVAALDSERWVQCNVSAERQAALTRLCSGRAAFSSRKTTTGTETVMSPGPSAGSKMTDAEVEGIRYKVVWSCLLLLEMVMDDVACAAHFQTLATNVVGKVAELLRLFNTRSTHLVLGAGAIHSAARLKSINAKHLAIVTQCIALVLTILPHIRAALMAQLPTKQHSLLYDIDKIKADYHEHSEKILNKLVSIIGGIVEHSLAPRISNTDFDERAKKASTSVDPNAPVDCCQFIDNVMTNTKKMHQVLLIMLPAELLKDVFSRIFAYLDHKVPSLFKAASTSEKFSMPSTDEGKLQMIKEVEYMAKTLNSLGGVQAWTFTATKVLEQELEIVRDTGEAVVVEEEELLPTVPTESEITSVKSEDEESAEKEIAEEGHQSNSVPPENEASSTEDDTPAIENETPSAEADTPVAESEVSTPEVDTSVVEEDTPSIEADPHVVVKEIPSEEVGTPVVESNVEEEDEAEEPISNQVSAEVSDVESSEVTVSDDKQEED